VAAGIPRLDGKGVRRAAKEIKAVSGGKGLVKMARTSVLLSMAQHARGMSAKTQAAVVSLVESALDLGESKPALVPALMALKTYPFYEALRTGADLPDDEATPAAAVDSSAEAKAQAALRRSAWENRRTAQPKGKLEPNMQGCLLLQALVALPAANEVVLDR
jgi:nucleolar protein 9